MKDLKHHLTLTVTTDNRLKITFWENIKYKISLEENFHSQFWTSIISIVD